eukprot:XP_001707333.1 Hypothetical protein GL50803_9787 [Giardia lamblia ATCC 50803]
MHTKIRLISVTHPVTVITIQRAVIVAGPQHVHFCGDARDG